LDIYFVHMVGGGLARLARGRDFPPPKKPLDG